MCGVSLHVSQLLDGFERGRLGEKQSGYPGYPVTGLVHPSGSPLQHTHSDVFMQDVCMQTYCTCTFSQSEAQTQTDTVYTLT